MMQTIASLKEGDWVDETYLVVSKQVSIAKTGATYLSLKLADKTGEVDGKLWDNAETVAGVFEREDFVRIKGTAANYQGSLQVKVKTLEKVADAKVDLGNFLETSRRDPAVMEQELRAAAAGIGNAYLRRLMEAFLNDKAFLEAFRRAPAAKALHHNTIGGLLEHVLELMSLARDAAKHFAGVDADLLTVGAFLHDIGKVRELAVRKSIEYTTEGRLLGHISLGYEMLTEKIKAVPGFPDELGLLLKHIVLSHHGTYEFGSPKRPKIVEALIVSHLDDLSAKVSSFQAAVRKENVTAGDWTAYSKMHERYLYRQAAYPDAAPEPKQGGRGADGEPGTTGELPLDI